MDLLARREHGRAELTRKLRQRGAPAELIEAALERLADEGLLSESRYIESFIRGRASSGYGPLRIREELTQRGLPRGEVEQALQACVTTGASSSRRCGSVVSACFRATRASAPGKHGSWSTGAIHSS